MIASKKWYIYYFVIFLALFLSSLSIAVLNKWQYFEKSFENSNLSSNIKKENYRFISDNISKYSPENKVFMKGNIFEKNWKNIFFINQEIRTIITSNPQNSGSTVYSLPANAALQIQTSGTLNIKIVEFATQNSLSGNILPLQEQNFTVNGSGYLTQNNTLSGSIDSNSFTFDLPNVNYGIFIQSASGVGTNYTMSFVNISNGKNIFIKWIDDNSNTIKYLGYQVNITDNKKYTIEKVSYTKNYPYSSCKDILTNNESYGSGIYNIFINNTIIPVYCDMSTDGGGWTVFQRRFNGSVNFYRNWNEYKNGFWFLQSEFWLGNKNISNLTATNKELYIELIANDGVKWFAKYSSFKINPESDKFRLLVSGYTGQTIGNSFTWHNNYVFSTFDSDNDSNAGTNCAATFSWAWWYNSCHTSNLNGLYLPWSHSGAYARGMDWSAFRWFYEWMKETKMMLR